MTLVARIAEWGPHAARLTETVRGVLEDNEL